MIWFTADTHLGHANIIRYCNRPFQNVQEMDRVLIDNINSCVAPNDILYHLGDFSFNRHKEYRDQINCKNIVLIYGNHDKLSRREAHGLFSGVYDLTTVKGCGPDIVLCHYAMRIWNKSHHGAWHLYGHSHGSLPDNPNSLSFDCGVDCHEYKPICLEKVREIMSRKTWKSIDHHA